LNPTPAFRNETRAAVEAVRAGLAVVLAREGAADVRLKSPGDLVTGTDVAGQAAIQRVLQRREPSIAFVGEEGDHAHIPETGRYWLVDPLCGTNNYAAGLPFYAVNVALVEDGRVCVGVVGDGVTGEVYAAQRGLGAWLLSDGDARPVRVDPGAQVVSLDPILPGPGSLKQFGVEIAIRALAEQRWSVRILSTTLALVYLARGSLGGAVYVCDGLPVHFAAGLLLAEEAGAIVTDESGKPWSTFGPIYVAAAAAELHEELRALAAMTVEALGMDAP
jgi:myo-inositol-1(or 4)-monophosphatase